MGCDGVAAVSLSLSLAVFCIPSIVAIWWQVGVFWLGGGCGVEICVVSDDRVGSGSGGSRREDGVWFWKMSQIWGCGGGESVVVVVFCYCCGGVNGGGVSFLCL